MHVDVAPRVRGLDAGLEERLDQAIALAGAHSGLQPAEDAAEGDEPDAVAPLEVAGGERRSGADGVVERAARRPPRTSKKLSTKSTTSVFRSGWRSFTTSACRRAEARQLIERTRSPGTKSRRSAYSIPSPFTRATSLPGEGLRLDGREDPAERLLAAGRPSAGARLAMRSLPDDEPEGIARAQLDVPDVVDAPARAAERQRDLTRLLAGCSRTRARRRRPRRPRLRAAGRGAPRAGRPRTLASQRELGLDLLVPRAPARPPTASSTSTFGSRASRVPSDEEERERRGDDGELGATNGERGDEPDRGERARSPRARGSPRRVIAAPRDVLGPRRRHASRAPRATTSSADTRCTQSSGRSTSRCASAGTATALTSSGSDEVAPGERRPAAGELEQREAAARARADRGALATRASPRRRRRSSARTLSATCTCSTARCISSSVSRSTTRLERDLVRLRARCGGRASRPRRREPGSRTPIRSRKRSSCASGSGYVPSYSIGFCVAITRNGGSSGCVTPSIVTWRSCIASRSAACVFGGARLISSARRRLVKIGPGPELEVRRRAGSRSTSRSRRTA